MNLLAEDREVAAERDRIQPPRLRVEGDRQVRQRISAMAEADRSRLTRPVPGEPRDDRPSVRLRGGDDVDLIVRRVVAVPLLNLGATVERPDRQGLEGRRRVVGEVIDHRSEVARPDPGIEPLDVGGEERRD